MMSGFAMQCLGWLLNVALVLGLWALTVSAIVAALRTWSGTGPARDAEVCDDHHH
jgi:hypothetical protein